ncbi:hypothetical protein TEA_024434 [Camellia sinensis var. sinensis]|uniref:Thiolase N-terminal domain-containing protein n=1 Tax=Camellia sinensis var. sinensis TaxID=542762 RepID=A0A4V3WJ79_CAMSN|nr:hypothetical protein TEA_024434 [Camellia sinensis var. sinensis]
MESRLGLYFAVLDSSNRGLPPAADQSASQVPGYGVITNIIYGNLECSHGTDSRVESRSGFYQRLRRVAIPNSQALSLLGRDLREAHLQVLLGGSGYRSSNANSSNAVTDPFLSSLILNFPSSKSKDILKSVLSSADDSSVKSVTSSHIWKASFDPSLSYEEREKRKRQAAERAEAIKCMHHSKRTMLTTDDVDNALNLRNVELIYGFASGHPLRFRRTAGHKDLFYIDDKDLDFKDVIEVPLPKAPLYTSIVCHWLAIEGAQPASPENAPVEEPIKRVLIFEMIVQLAYRTALCKSKREGFKDTYPDDLLAPVLRCPETVPIRTMNRQCSSGLQAVADVAAAIKAGFYDIGIGAGLESMTANPMAWEGSVNPRVKTMAQHQDCLLPTGVTSIGFQTSEDYRFYAISTGFSEFSNKDKTLN